MSKLSNEMEELVKAFLAIGFVDTDHRVLRREVSELHVSIVTDYNPEFLWMQCRFRGEHDSNNSYTDIYIKSIADYEEAMVRFLIEHGRKAENARFASILKIDQYR